MASRNRIIDSNDAMHFLRESKVKETGAFSKGINKGLDIALSAIGNKEIIPTVESVGVVHGHWIVKHNPITDPKGYFIRIVCSQCDLHTGQKSNYCPQCGAKMDR